MKKITVIGLIVAIAFALCGCQSGIETYELTMAYQDTGEFSADALVRAAEEIGSQTKGAVTISLKPAGGADEVYSELTGGAADMAFMRVHAEEGAMAEIAYFPYLVTDYEEGRTVWTEGSGFYSIFDEIQAASGLKLLGLFPAGFMGLGAIELNTETCFDFSVIKEGLIRIPDMYIMKVMAETMGFRTYAFLYSDIEYALKTGIAHGWTGACAQANLDEFSDSIKYYVDYRYANDLFSVLMDRELFDSMPPEFQEIIKQAFMAESTAAIDEREALDKRAIDGLAGIGVTVLAPTGEEREAMADYMRAHGWPKLESRFGKEIIDRLKS
jgi:C4-dicarboxylate-binding protein DctP